MKLKFSRRMQAVQWRIDNAHNSTTLSMDVCNAKNIKVGNHSYGEINTESYENKNEGLIIGDFVSIASNVLFILGGNHKVSTFTTYPIKSHFLTQSPEDDAETKGVIIVEDEVWIGNNVIVMSGIKIGKGAIVAAGSVVTKDVMRFSIVGGNPAKFIKWRIPEDLINERSKLNLSDFNIENIKNNVDLFYKDLDTETLQLIKEKV